MKIKYCAWLIALIAVNNVIYFTPSLASGYYIAMAGAFVFCFALSRGMFQINYLGVLLWITAGLSICANDVPYFFSPWIRFFTFVLVSGLLGPFIFSRTFCKFRIDTFWILNWLFALVIFFSFLGNFLGFSMAQPYLGYLCGITNHSMILGIISGCTLLYFINILQYPSAALRKNMSKKWLLVLSCISILLLLGSASRSAALATLVGLAFAAACYFHNKKFQLFKILIVFTVIIIATEPFWVPYFEKIEQKNNNESVLNLSSREEHWITHWNSFRGSPVFGIGFASIDIDNSISTFGDDGRVETGSSWLSIFSMTGLLGAISFLLLLLQQIKNLWDLRNKFPGMMTFLGSVLMFFLVHMCAEGYIFAAGGIAFFYFWLILGTISAYSYLFISPRKQRGLN